MLKDLSEIILVIYSVNKIFKAAFGAQKAVFMGGFDSVSQ